MLYIQPAYNLQSQYLRSTFHYAVYPTSLQLAVSIPPIHLPLCCISNQLTTCCLNTSRPPSTMLYIQPAYNLLSQYLPSTFHYAVYPTSLQLAVPIRPVHHPLSDMARQLESCDFKRRRSPIFLFMKVPNLEKALFFLPHLVNCKTNILES